MATPHIESNKLDIAKTVIMPGDPRRVEYIVKKYLNDYILINEVRGELGFTGYYKGKKITVFSSGMGIPSMGIYSHELFTEYDVNAIIRIGSAGSYTNDLKINDLFLVESTYSESNYATFYNNDTTQEIVESNEELNKIITETSTSLNIELKKGRCHSTESFYTNEFSPTKIKEEKNCDCVEMETYSLFTNAKYLNKKAACLLTISDSFITGESMSSEQRETSFDKMITLVLESTLKIED